MGSAYSYETLIIGRVIVGVAVGLSSGTVPLFIAELAPIALRGKLIALNNVCIVSGQVLAAIIDGSFATHPDGWRWMLGLGGVPALIQLAGAPVEGARGLPLLRRLHVSHPFRCLEPSPSRVQQPAASDLSPNVAVVQLGKFGESGARHHAARAPTQPSEPRRPSPP